MTLTKHQITEFQSTIFHWWKTNKRDLPWRHTHDPYKIIISEVMLQQTQVLRVIPKYAEFIETYPTVNSLARASTADILRVWKGMGYNRRALYLHRMAKTVVRDYKGKFPKDEKLLTKLPGLGIYTARALLVFAYRENIACIDTNIRQIITHFFFYDIPQKPRIIQEIADKLLPEGKSWQWHQALMDYGSVYNSEFGIQNPESKKHKIPFKETDRFFRGRVVDLLREEDWKEEKLINFVAKKYKKPIPFIRRILQQLVNDGLMIHHNDIVSLPR